MSDAKPPTLGRIVMYEPYGTMLSQSVNEKPLPAIVVKVHSPTMVNLQVFQDRGGDGTVYATSVSEGTGSNTWHWPERA
jgi:hypothetical protein